MDTNASLTVEENSLQELYAAGCYRLDMVRINSNDATNEAIIIINARADALRDRWDSLYSDLAHIEDIETHGIWAIKMMEEVFDEILVFNAELGEDGLIAASVKQSAIGYRVLRLVEQARQSDAWRRLDVLAQQRHAELQSSGEEVEEGNHYAEQLTRAKTLLEKISHFEDAINMYLVVNAEQDQEVLIDLCTQLQSTYEVLMTVLHEEQ